MFARSTLRAAHTGSTVGILRAVVDPKKINSLVKRIPAAPPVKINDVEERIMRNASKAAAEELANESKLEKPVIEVSKKGEINCSEDEIKPMSERCLTPRR